MISVSSFKQRETGPTFILHNILLKSFDAVDGVGKSIAALLWTLVFFWQCRTFSAGTRFYMTIEVSMVKEFKAEFSR